MSSDNYDFLNSDGSNDANYESVISSFIRRFREEKPTAPADRLGGLHSPKKKSFWWLNDDITDEEKDRLTHTDVLPLDSNILRESIVSEDLSYLSRDSSLFETIQVLNQKKIPSDFDRLTDEEDPRKHLPVPLQSLIASSGQPVHHPLTPSQTVISTISSSSSSNPIDNVDDDLLPTHLGKEFSDRNYGDYSTTGIGNNNHSLLLNGNDGIDNDNDEVADFDVDSFTNQLLERCEVLLQDYRARKEPASNDIAKGKMMPTTTTTNTTTTTTTRAPVSERSHHFNNNGDGDSNDDVVISNSKNPAAAVVDVQTSTRRQAATAMDVGIQTVSVSSSGTQLKKSSVSVGVGVGGDVDGDVSGVRVDHSSNTLGTVSEGSGLLYLSSSSEEEEDDDEDVEDVDEDEDDDVYCYDGGQKEVHDTVAQDGSTPLSLEAFENDDAKPLTSQAVGIAVRYPDLLVPDRKENKIGIHAKQSESLSSPLPAANEVRAAFEVPPPPPPPPGGGLNDVDVDDVVVDLQYVQPYLHDDHVQELWRRLGEVEAALHLRGAVTVDSNRVSRVTGITTASSSQKAQYIRRRYH